MSNKERTPERPIEPIHARQGRFSWVLPMAMVLLYLVFFAVFAFAPDLLGGGIGDDPTSPLAWGIPVALGLSLLAFVLAGLYVRRVREGTGE
jgi:uncharacterized membrane protein (DUF485 family)